jgi:L-threonylcarbamoyladenylate synthase
MSNIQNDIRHAATLLSKGQLVAFPTETVYGLGANALSDSAVAAIYAAKERPSFNPLIVHVATLEQANTYAVFSERALLLARHFWPGPLTLVLPRREGCALSLLVSAGLDSVAIRMPAHPLAQALLHETQLPIAAPSANRSGRVSPTAASHVQEELGDDVAMILDGGPCHVGLESTVVDMTCPHPAILRPGTVTPQQISHMLGVQVSVNTAAQPGDKLASPGMLASHYAPRLPVRLNATSVKADEALLAFGKNIPSGALVTQNLSPGGNLQEAAANLFRMLRLLDASDATGIAVMPVPEEGEDNGLGVAINDRLRRASAPRA